MNRNYRLRIDQRSQLRGGSPLATSLIRNLIAILIINGCDYV